jgi:hypothetical protein
MTVCSSKGGSSATLTKSRLAVPLQFTSTHAFRHVEAVGGRWVDVEKLGS